MYCVSPCLYKLVPCVLSMLWQFEVIIHVSVKQEGMHFLHVMSGSSVEGEAVLLKPCESLDKQRGQNVMCTCRFVLQSDLYPQSQVPKVDTFSHGCYQALSAPHVMK